MSWPSWVGSVWGLRGAEGSVVGQVRGVEGESLVLAVAGLATDARIPVATLLAHWDRLTGDLARFLAAPHRAAAG